MTQQARLLKGFSYPHDSTKLVIDFKAGDIISVELCDDDVSKVLLEQVRWNGVYAVKGSKGEILFYTAGHNIQLL